MMGCMTSMGNPPHRARPYQGELHFEANNNSISEKKLLLLSEEEVDTVESDQGSGEDADDESDDDESDFEEFTPEQILDKKIVYYDPDNGCARVETIAYLLSWKGFDKLDI